MKKLLVLVLTLCLVFTLAACGGSAKEEGSEAEQEAAETEVPKDEQEGSAGSNIPLKDNQEEAEKQITAALQAQLEEAYGDKIDDVRISVEKIYSTEDEQANDILKEENLSPDEVAFEVKYDLHPSDGTDYNELLPANGEYDKASGWVVDKYSVGILRPNGDGTYKITDFGTGW